MTETTGPLTGRSGDPSSPATARPAEDALNLLPFMAPCRTLAPGAPLRWVALGWADFRRAPGPSLAYGLVIVLLSWLVTGIGLKYGTYWSALILLSGFVFVAPLFAFGLYFISRQVGEGK